MTLFATGIWRLMLSPQVAGLSLPPFEELACDDCPMVRRGILAPQTKCCTYVPPIPNFLVGQILAEGDPAGAATLRQWIAGRRGDPLFLNVPESLVGAHRERVLPCPLLDAAGRCTIYDHRPYLCRGYRCVFPPDEKLKALWNCLASLLALYSAIGPHWVLELLGFDRIRLVDTWAAMPPEAELWSSDGGIRPVYHARLWQRETDPEAFYLSCYQVLVENAPTSSHQLERFRREQLLRQLRSLGRLTPAREAELRAPPGAPHPVEPPPELQAAFASRILSFAEHFFTAREHESYLLWYG